MKKESPERKTKRVAFARRQFDRRKKVGSSRLDVAGTRLVKRYTGAPAGMPAVEMEMREHPGRDPFKNLRFLVLIFFAA